MRIQNNVTAVNSHRQYGINVDATGKIMEKLSSGYRVNRAADDAAGLAISEKMRTQIRGLSMAARNTQDGVSLLQVADGAMQLAHGILQRMRELAAQSANGVNDDKIDREAIDLEYQHLISELDQIADTTNFNGVYPLKGSAVQNPKNTTLTNTGISSSQIPQMNEMQNLVPDATGTGLGTLTGTTYTQIVPGTYTITAAQLASVTDITLGTGVNLIITGDVTNNLSFYGSGSARINGNIEGNLNNLNQNGKVQVTGYVTGTVINAGEMTIGPSAAAPTPYTGQINNTSTGKMYVAQAGARINTNMGDMRIASNNTTVTSNSGNLRYQPISPATITWAQVTNSTTGRIEVSSGSRIGPSLLNHGTIFVENGGQIGQTGNTNNGLIEVAQGGTVTITNNSANGRIISHGSAYIINNSGYIQYGNWGGDSSPAGGSTTGVGEVLNNTSTGVIRNFLANFTLYGNNGQIDNYGTITFDVDYVHGGEIRHHARGLITTGVGPDKNAPQEIRFTANGKPQTLSGTWNQVAGGYELTFSSSIVDYGTVVFDSFGSYRVPGMQYGIQQDPANPLTIPNSDGTSGTILMYFMEEPFVIQSGANEGDATYLNFRSLNAMSLGQDVVSPHGDCLFENIGESHIRTMEAASCALTLTLKAINDVSIYRAELGAQYNRLEYKYDNLNNSTENLSAAESRIRDADMAKKMTYFTKNNILVQSSTAMLAQANALPQGVLQLLG